ncbi:MAG: SLC13 family permease, partial [Gordonibacter pamelaeae]
MRPLASRIARFARERTVLVVSALAALATVPFVPPDEAYLGYFDVKTLACLFGILAVVGALRGIGLFEHAARLIVARFVTCRSAVAALVGSTLVLSMFATNDLALIMMLPPRPPRCSKPDGSAPCPSRSSCRTWRRTSAA